MTIIDNLSRTDIEKLIDEYMPVYYEGSDFKENAKNRILDGMLFDKMIFNSNQPKPGQVFLIELNRFIKWAYERSNNDAVPVVRCKDCKHYRYYGLDSYTVSECKIDHAESPDENWFCADGERKDADES